VFLGGLLNSVGSLLFIDSGTGFSDEVEGIAGDPDNVFSIEGFDALEGEQVECGIRYPSKLSHRLFSAITQRKKAEPREPCIDLVVARVNSKNTRTSVIHRSAINFSGQSFRHVAPSAVAQTSELPRQAR